MHLFYCIISLLAEPRYLEETYPASVNKMEDYISVNWVLDAVKEGEAPPNLTPEDRMALQLLSHLLMGTTASPLYKALTESGLGKSMIGGGVGLDLRHAIFSAGLKGERETTLLGCYIRWLFAVCSHLVYLRSLLSWTTRRYSAPLQGPRDALLLTIASLPPHRGIVQ